MDYFRLYRQLLDQFPSFDIKLNSPLAPYTTLKIGGPADILIHSKSSEQFTSLLNFVYQFNYQKNALAKAADKAPKPETLGQKESGAGNALTGYFPIHILGHGSNVLISDSGLRGLTIINCFDSSQLNPTPSGALLQPLILHLLNQNLLGLEEFAYIPCTLGGAIYSNIHGFVKNNFSKYLNNIEVFDLATGQTQLLPAASLTWDYDTSYFQSHPTLVILSATFNLVSGSPITAQKLYHHIIQLKSASQPTNSAGCVFKNFPAKANHPPLSAGKLIDQLNLKGTSVGGAQVSPLHANFIVNTGLATAADYLSLVRLIQSRVKSACRLDLELEIKLLGEF